LRQVKTPDIVVDHYPEICAGCGAALTAATASSHTARQVFDLPEPRPPVVTEHRVHVCSCARCGKLGIVPRGARGAGPRAPGLILVIQSRLTALTSRTAISTDPRPYLSRVQSYLTALDSLESFHLRAKEMQRHWQREKCGIEIPVPGILPPPFSLLMRDPIPVPVARDLNS
jgi:hypothetical protein